MPKQVTRWEDSHGAVHETRHEAEIADARAAVWAAINNRFDSVGDATVVLDVIMAHGGAVYDALSMAYGPRPAEEVG